MRGGTPQTSESPGEPSAYERLFDAAKELFAAEGYENATTSAIARQAGTSESQLIKHFGSKEGLLEAIFDATWRSLEGEVGAALQQLRSPLRKIQALGAIVASTLEKDPRVRSLLLLEARRIRKKGREVVISAGFKWFLQSLDKVFQEMQEQGQLRPDVHIEAVRSAYMGAYEGLLRDQFLAELIDYPARYDHREVAKTATMVLSAFLTPETQRALRQIDG